MSLILLADDSPHAQRMGERILREEGFEVATVTDGRSVLLRIPEVDPEVIIADAFLPGLNGFDLCRQVKAQSRHVRVILTAGLLESLDEEEARRAGCDAVLRKPFEASVVMRALRPLVHDAQLARGLFAEAMASAQPLPVSDAPPVPPPPPPPDPEKIQAAITLALDAALPGLVREITEKVLIALGQ